jgi:NAD(P)-dependent dehydrogenase (short-subunit alcohol dehydrogenase family)
MICRWTDAPGPTDQSARTYDRAVDALDSFRLDGRVGVVIGGSGVLGSQMAHAMAEVGARVVIVGRDPGRGQAAAQRLRRRALDVVFASGDASNRQDLVQIRDGILATHGRVDVLVNAAGVNSATAFLDISDEEMERIVAVNQLGVVRACQVFGGYFVDRATATGEGASIITVGSMSGLTPLSRVFTYSMTKAAIHNLTKNLAREWGPLGIRCNVIVPGFFPAKQNRALLSDERADRILAHTPAGRFGRPQDLVGVTLLLASDAGEFLTGSELVVDGGFHVVTV